MSFTLGLSDYVRDEEELDEAVERVYRYVHRKVEEKLEAAKDGSL